ncbi:hypothetical protein VTH8203_03301 [Vibrio thalassae]|uniref:Iron-containing redox enzyme n=1 Tax=Vibrio thalassae TaxID=1243014 RepID=A0A240EN15_9VIBR|nr:hypothetical protein [Vibrio thalassae]SNX49653.1 hypothetical protein VTH8203_03301 [Vibrio thalassae]
MSVTNINADFETLTSHWSSMNNPRENARKEMMESVGAETWTYGKNFAKQLRSKIFQHPVATNPMIRAMNEGQFSFQQMRHIHLEYRHAIVQIFVDALLKLTFNCESFDNNLKPGSKQAPRFLILLNLLDELGFLPGLDESGYYKGNPIYSHYPLYEDVLYAYQISDEDRKHYEPSVISSKVRECLQAEYNNVLGLAALLATAEIQVMLFSPPLRENSAKVGINTDEGYYMVHGCADNGQEFANDDDHEADLWLLVAMLVNSDNAASVENVVMNYCDLWDEFWLHQHTFHS